MENNKLKMCKYYDTIDKRKGCKVRQAGLCIETTCEVEKQIKPESTGIKEMSKLSEAKILSALAHKYRNDNEFVKFVIKKINFLLDSFENRNPRPSAYPTCPNCGDDGYWMCPECLKKIGPKDFPEAPITMLLKEVHAWGNRIFDGCYLNINRMNELEKIILDYDKKKYFVGCQSCKHHGSGYFASTHCMGCIRKWNLKDKYEPKD